MQKAKIVKQGEGVAAVAPAQDDLLRAALIDQKRRLLAAVEAIDRVLGPEPANAEKPIARTHARDVESARTTE